MAQVVFPTSPTPEIVIVSVDGDLRLAGWDLDQFQAETSNPDDLTAEQAAEGVRLTCRSDVSVNVPRQTRVTVQNVKGDLRGKSLGGNLDIQMVGGCLALRYTGAVSAARVNGDVDAKRVGGALKLGNVAGGVKVRGVSGELEIDAHGDVDVNQAGRSIRARAGGDLDLRHCLTPGAEYDLQADSDIRLRATPGVWTRFEMQAGGEVIAKVQGGQVEGDAKHKVVTLGQSDGSGATPVHVMARAKGDVILVGAEATAEMDDLSEDIGRLADEYAAQIETQVHSHMAELQRLLAEQLARVNVPAGTVEFGGAEVAARVREAVERASDKARRRVQAAQRKMERQSARARHDWNWKFETPPRGPGAAPAAPAAEPASEAERLAILKMLAEGKISVDDAELLLAALEGRA
jgi:hypothetical protein